MADRRPMSAARSRSLTQFSLVSPRWPLFPRQADYSHAQEPTLRRGRIALRPIEQMSARRIPESKVVGLKSNEQCTIRKIAGGKLLNKRPLNSEVYGIPKRRLAGTIASRTNDFESKLRSIPQAIIAETPLIAVSGRLDQEIGVVRSTDLDASIVAHCVRIDGRASRHGSQKFCQPALPFSGDQMPTMA